MNRLLAIAIAAGFLSGCTVVSVAVDVVTLPVKVVYKTGSAVAGALTSDDEKED